MKRALLILAYIVLAVMTVSAQSDFAPFPKAKDNYWRKRIPRAMRLDYIALGDQFIAKPWDAIPDTLFSEFKRNGNRTRYEAASFGIRKQFACLVMAEIMEHQGRFLPSIRHGLHYFMEKEPWWGIPAHYPKARPERNIQTVDLFNAETADMLAWTLYMLEEEIDSSEPGLCAKVKDEIDRRFLNPTLYNKQGWKRNANNWNTWITANWLQTVLICERDAEKRAAAFEGVKQCLRTFLKGYPDDGGCEEGISYWDCAGASFFESLHFLQFAPESAALPLTDKDKRKVEAMGEFITTMYIDDVTFVNFSDAQARHTPNINILFPYGRYIKNKAMMRLAAYIGAKNGYLSHPTDLFVRSGNYPKLGRELMFLAMLPQYRSTRAAQPKTSDAYLDDSQIMVARGGDWFVAAKGGNNAESHNHNDVGNFILYYQNRPVIIDLGSDTYTAKTFSDRRFELTNCRSAYHNVPMVNGFEQKDGRQYRAENAHHTSNSAASSFSLDIAKAYPTGAGVEKWTRRLTLDRKGKSVTVEEDFRLASGSGKTEIILLCYGEPHRSADGDILLCDGGVRLAFPHDEIDASWEKVAMDDGIMKTQWKDNIYRLHLLLKKDIENGTFAYSFSKR